MSLAALNRVGSGSLSDLVDAIAGRTGGWLLVEQVGAVMTHGTGGLPCPPPLAAALLTKSIRPLRDTVVWGRGSRPLTGSLGDVPVIAVDLGAGATAWFVGGPVEEASLAVLAAAVHTGAQPVTDPVVEALLHPRGPVRRGGAPQALLVALRSDDPIAALSARAAAVVAGTEARVYADDDVVLVALPTDGDADALAAHVRRWCPTSVAGVARVAEGASDWVAAARLASGSACAAADLGLALGRATDPAIAAELVVQEAQGAVADLLRELSDAPLRRLQEHDARTSGELVASMTAWCRAGFDVPAAAAALHVHNNTLRYRLKRAGEVSGLDVTRPRQLLALQLLLAV